MSNLRAAIAEAYANSEADAPRGACTCRECGAGVADTLLAMPEMVAIRGALRMLHTHGGPGYLDYLDLPESVIAWVVDE